MSLAFSLTILLRYVPVLLLLPLLLSHIIIHPTQVLTRPGCILYARLKVFPPMALSKSVLSWGFLQVITRTSPASLPVFCCSSRHHILRRSSWLQGWSLEFESSIENTTGSRENRGIHNKEATKQQRGRKVL